MSDKNFSMLLALFVFSHFVSSSLIWGLFSNPMFSTIMLISFLIFIMGFAFIIDGLSEFVSSEKKNMYLTENVAKKLIFGLVSSALFLFVAFSTGEVFKSIFYLLSLCTVFISGLYGIYLWEVKNEILESAENVNSIDEAETSPQSPSSGNEMIFEFEAGYKSKD